MNLSVIRRPFTYRYYNVSLILIGINVFVFFINMLLPNTRTLLAMNPVLVLRQGYVWQVFTYMFVHANLYHILFNMLGLFFFGYQVEQRVGSSEFLLFYLVSGFGAGIFSLLVYWFYRRLLCVSAGSIRSCFCRSSRVRELFPAREYLRYGNPARQSAYSRTGLYRDRAVLSACQRQFGCRAPHSSCRLCGGLRLPHASPSDESDQDFPGRPPIIVL